jgi:hypothetical protein
LTNNAISIKSKNHSYLLPDSHKGVNTLKKTIIMKQEVLNDTVDILHKIETIEKEVVNLKLSVLKKLTPAGKKVISLKGILKGVDITEKDIASAKKSLYSKIP